MKISKKTAQLLKDLDEMEQWLDYWSGSHPKLMLDVRARFDRIREMTREIGEDLKEHDARLAKKLKALWRREHED